MPGNISQVEATVRQADHLQGPPLQPERVAVERQPNNGTGMEAVSRQVVQDKAAGGQQSVRQLSAEETQRLMESLNQVLNIFDIEARIMVDRQTQTRVIQLRDNTTQKLIRQVPSQEFLSRLVESRDLIGLLVDQIV